MIINKEFFHRSIKGLVIAVSALCLGTIVSGVVSLAACCEITNRWGEKRYYDTFSEGWCYAVHAASSNANTMTTIKLLTNWEASTSKQTIRCRGEKYTVGKYNLGSDLKRKHVEGLDNSKSEVDGFSGGHLNVKDGKRFTIDLNGFNIDRKRGNNQDDDGELINVSGGAYLRIIDSNPNAKKTIDGVQTTGGCLMGGASEDGAGGIHIKDGGYVHMTGGNICANQTNEDGGGVYVNGGSSKLFLENVHVFRNKTRDAKSDTNGAGVYVNGGRVRIRNCIFRRNESEDYGGGIFSDEGNGYIVIEDSQFIGNRANDNSGGGIYIDRGNLKIKNCTFDGNYAREKGGGIFVEDDDGAVIRDCTFINNSANKHGGAFYADDDDIHFINCVIHNNKAGENGGGVYLDHDADINFQGVMKVYDNRGSGNRKDDVYFDPESRVHSGGLLDGSNIGVRSRKSFKILENITQYEYDKFFKSNTGSLSKKIRSTTDETFLASVFANKSIMIIAGIILLAIVSAIVGVVAGRKRKQKNTDTLN